MLVRQTLGGKLSRFDIYLLRAFISFGFAVAIGAILPPLLILFELQRVLIWPIASVWWRSCWRSFSFPWSTRGDG